MRAVQRVFSRRFGVASNLAADSGVMPGATAKSMASVDLGFSLAADRVTSRGETFRNPDVRTLIEHIPKGAVEIKKGGVVSHAGASAAATPIGATDALPGSSSIVDVDAFDEHFKTVVDEKLSFAPALFVQDGAFGSSRGTEVRMRVIADCPVMGLAARALLHRVPLYSPQVFPRTITVYAATKRYGWMGSEAQQPRVVVDVDPSTNRASILIWGDANAHDLSRAVAVAANGLSSLGGAYRSQPGGSQDPNLSAARSDGSLSHYLRDGHYYPAATEPQPDVLLLPPRSATIVGGSGAAAPTLIIGADATSSIATAAAAGGKLLSTGSALWHATEGVSSSFAAALVANEAASGYKALPEGTVLQKAGAIVPWAAAGVKSFGNPSRVLVVGSADASPSAVAAVVAQAAGWSAGLSDKAKLQLKSRLTAAGVSVEIVKDAKAAADAIAAAK